MDDSYSLKRVHTINNVLYISQVITAYIFLVSNEHFDCDGYIYFLSAYLTVFVLMLNACFLMRFICAPLQGYPRSILYQSAIGYIFPLAMAVTHVICCCGLFDAPENHLLYRKTNTSQMFNTLLISVIMICILCNSTCIAQSFAYKTIILYISIAIIHLSFSFNPYLINYRKIHNSVHGFLYYAFSTSMVAMELIALLLFIFNCIHFKIENVNNSYLLQYNTYIWIGWYISSMPFAWLIYYFYYVRKLFDSIQYVNLPWVMSNTFVPLVNWLLHIGSGNYIDKVYSVIHISSHTKRTRATNAGVQSNDTKDTYVRLPFEQSSVHRLATHTKKESVLCLKYQLQYIKLKNMNERVAYMRRISTYDGILKYKYCSKWMFILVYKIILQLCPVFWFIYGYMYVNDGSEFHFSKWIENDVNKNEHLLCLVLMCMYGLTLLCIVIFGYKLIVCEYYYGFIRHIMKQKQKQNCRNRMHVNCFYEGLLLKRCCLNCLIDAGFMYDICVIILTYLIQQ
eukprot:28436_1